jgi:hypothetical protein
MKNYICVFDFETDGPNQDICQPVQLAACMIDFRTLDIIKDSEFCSYMRPEGILDEGYYEAHKETIVWHAKNYNPDWHDMDEEQFGDACFKIYNKWLSAPNQEQVFSDFCKYLLKYNTNQSRKTKWTSPIRAGINVRDFDNIIMDRLCQEYDQVDKNAEQKIFFPRDKIDILDLSFYWFESLTDGPKNYKMDTLREFLGLPSKGSHDALKDVKDEALVIQRFMRLHRSIAHKVQFRDSMKNETKNREQQSQVPVRV